MSSEMNQETATSASGVTTEQDNTAGAGSKRKFDDACEYATWGYLVKRYRNYCVLSKRKVDYENKKQARKKAEHAWVKSFADVDIAKRRKYEAIFAYEKAKQEQWRSYQCLKMSEKRK